MHGKSRIYFMSSPPNCRENSLHAIDVPDNDGELQRPQGDYSWIQILQSGFQVSKHYLQFINVLRSSS